MEGYLLDTNIIEFWFNRGRQEHTAVCGRIAGLPAATPLVTSVIVIGEIQYGSLLAPKDGRVALSEMADFIRRRLPRVVEVTSSTATVYGDLRARLFSRYAPRNKRKGLRPEQLVAPITSESLGIQENDLWIAAQAIERNLVLATNDRLLHIHGVAPELRVEDWARRPA